LDRGSDADCVALFLARTGWVLECVVADGSGRL
jgi:hypothetical protein